VWLRYSADCPVIAVRLYWLRREFLWLALIDNAQPCAPGGVKAIDNGFGAAILAGQITA